LGIQASNISIVREIFGLPTYQLVDAADDSSSKKTFVFDTVTQASRLTENATTATLSGGHTTVIPELNVAASLRFQRRHSLNFETARVEIDFWYPKNSSRKLNETNKQDTVIVSRVTYRLKPGAETEITLGDLGKFWATVSDLEFVQQSGFLTQLLLTIESQLKE